MDPEETPEVQSGTEAPVEPGPTPAAPTPPEPSKPRPRLGQWLSTLKKHPTIHLFGTTLAVLIGMTLAGALLLFALGYPLTGPLNTANPELNTQTLGTEALNKLTKESAQLGGAGQLLVIGADSAFKGNIIADKNLTVVGTSTFSNLKVTGPFSLSDLIVTNSTTLQKAVTIQDLLTVRGNLNVSGDGSVGGNLTVGTLTARNTSFNGTVGFNGHITTAGTAPSVVAGPGLGSGGTVSLSGNDSAGTIVIGAGTGPSAGTFATITFRGAYGSTPRVIISPVGSATGNLNYYVTRTQTGFVVAGNNPTTGATYSFDYWVMQ